MGGQYEPHQPGGNAMNLRVTVASAITFLTAVAVTQQLSSGSTAGISSFSSVTPILGSLLTQQEIDTVMVRISGEGVVVRAAPKNDAKKLVAVGDGTVAWNKGRVGTWYKVKFKHGTVGYVPAANLVAVYSVSTDEMRPSTYKVVKGDNDVTIARKLGVRAKALRLANPGLRWNALKPGKVLKVPSEAVSAAAAKVKINQIDTSAARVNTNSVVMRSGPTTMSGKVAVMRMRDKVYIVGQEGAWYHVKTMSGVKGYIRGDYLNALRAEPALATTRTSSGRAVSSAGYTFADAGDFDGLTADIVAEARRHIGTRYRWGGESTRGFDCSGFVRYVFRKSEGINLPRTSREQSRFGQAVSRDSLQAGDIISFATGGGSRVSHVGVYIGNNKFIHSSSSRGVRIDTLTGYYAKRYVNARRPVANPKITLADIVAKPKEEIEPESSPIPPDTGIGDQ
jgi:cell wall-associated NlpC family hydrolase